MTFLRFIAVTTLLIPAAAALGADRSGHRVGLVAGPTYGAGLSYGQEGDSKGIAWQVSGFPVWLEKDRLLYGGVTLFRTVHERGERGMLRLFLSGGFAAFYSWHEDGDGRKRDGGIDEDLSLVFGPGVGLGLRLGPFDFLADLPIAMFFSNEISRDKTRFEVIPYIPNMACFYRW